MLQIALIFHSSRNDNLGVGALTVSEIEIIRNLSKRLGIESHITIIDWKGHRPPYATGPDITVCDLTRADLLSPSGYFSLIRKTDLVIDIGSGDSFADIYGPKRLRIMLGMKFLVHLLGKPMVIAPQTIGPFTKGRSVALSRWSLNRSAVLATRDPKSTACVHEMGVKVPVIEASDVALRLPYTPPAPRVPGTPPKIGINVSGLLMRGGYDGKNMFGLSLDYPALVRQLIAGFQARPEGCEVHLVPHVFPIEPQPGDEITRIEDDRQASLALAEEFPGVQVAPMFMSPSEAKSYIAGLDFFTGARMHACIAAFSSGVPVVPMAYSRKFEGLFGSLGYKHTVDCTTGDQETIAKRIFRAFEQRTDLAADAATALALGRQKLGAYEDALAEVMRKAAARKR